MPFCDARCVYCFTYGNVKTGCVACNKHGICCDCYDNYELHINDQSREQYVFRDNKIVYCSVKCTYTGFFVLIDCINMNTYAKYYTFGRTVEIKQRENLFYYFNKQLIILLNSHFIKDISKLIILFHTNLNYKLK